MDEDYGIEIPLSAIELFRCELCHFFRSESLSLKCNHPAGAAIKRYPEQPAGFNRGIFCKNWREDYPIKLPHNLRK